eukprot:CFRG1279T1
MFGIKSRYVGLSANSLLKTQTCLLRSAPEIPKHKQGTLRCILSPHITELSRKKIENPEVESQMGKRRNLPGSPWKLNLVAKQVRGMPVLDAIDQMKFSNKKAAQDVKHVLYNTMHAASHNKGMDAKKLVVAQCYVGKGQYTKAIRYQGRGSMSLMRNKESHLFVELQEGEAKKGETRMMRRERKHINSRKPKKIRSALL